ncbi:hypothetical protein LRS13_07230 [Svornostia abyssi]|uniref:Uncharacterized protein n=1 Tax=Svornostia abyssi TaxID=2898438 RepID=A0ABY5PL98_9ACTN|nr:hypothetical protein LRS13_07230 [Parviterribacteraceae bacterium J379]
MPVRPYVVPRSAAERQARRTPAAIEKHITSILQTLDPGREPTEHRRVHAVLTLLRSR